MPQAEDFLKTAEDLIENGTGRRPRATNLRRAVSTIYYALFHCLAETCANTMIGTTGADRSNNAWAQVYRSLHHGTAKSACQHQEMMKKFPKDVEDFANTFVEMQGKRHDADYNPDATFTKSDVMTDIEDARAVIKSFKTCPKKNRLAFAAWVLLYTKKAGRR